MRLVLCTRPDSAASWALRVYMWSKWSHVAIWDDEAGLIYDSALRQGGVRATPQMQWLLDYPLIETRPILIPPERKEEARAWLWEQVGKPYDWGAIVGIFFRQRQWADADAWFCSELAEAFRAKFERVRFAHDLWRITPGHLAMTV